METEDATKQQQTIVEFDNQDMNEEDKDDGPMENLEDFRRDIEFDKIDIKKVFKYSQNHLTSLTSSQQSMTLEESQCLHTESPH